MTSTQLDDARKTLSLLIVFLAGMSAPAVYRWQMCWRWALAVLSAVRIQRTGVTFRQDLTLFTSRLRVIQ